MKNIWHFSKFFFVEFSLLAISFPRRTGVIFAHLGFAVSEILAKDEVPTMYRVLGVLCL